MLINIYKGKKSHPRDCYYEQKESEKQAVDASRAVLHLCGYAALEAV